MQLKVGQLARECGVSIKALHHYDQLGLLKPSERSESGHRLYNYADFQRLQQIVSLRCLGFSLDEISGILNSGGSSVLKTIELHLSSLKQEIETSSKLLTKLESIAVKLRSGANPSTEEIFDLIEDSTMFEKYYSQDQLQRLNERARSLGPDKIKETENEWAKLINEVREAIKNGASPDSPEVQKLADRWQSLLKLFTGEDPSMTESLGRMYQSEGAASASKGMIDQEVFEFIGQAFKYSS